MEWGVHAVGLIRDDTPHHPPQHDAVPSAILTDGSPASDVDALPPGMTASLSDADLVARARGGNEHAFRQLVERYEGQVAATIVGMLGRTPEADDVGQETFVRFYRSLDRFRGDASVGTYLTRIAINTSLNAIERRKRWQHRFQSSDDEAFTAPPPATSGGQDVDAQERRRLVRWAIRQLSPDHRAVVVLRMIQGHSTKETAALLDIPPGTVMSRLYRALDNLKDHLGPFFDDLRDDL
jgi:RNA polymerase sigma-70 factor (ECF subfamily)